MNQSYDNNIIQQLADEINTGWPHLYQAVVYPKTYMLEKDDQITGLEYPAGRLFVKFLDEKGGDKEYYKAVNVERVGSMETDDGKTATVAANRLVVTVFGNRGIIETTDKQEALNFVNTMQNIFKEQLTHLVYPGHSYVELDKNFPVEWTTSAFECLDKTQESEVSKIDFTILGTGCIPVEAYGSVPGVMDITELAKAIIGLVQPVESLTAYDFYRGVAQTGKIHDSFVSPDTFK